MFRLAGVSALVLIAAAVAVAADPPPRGLVRPLDPSSNPTTPEKVALGAKLFTEKRLSGDGSVACATCHVTSMGFSDGRATSVGIGGQIVPRNAPTLLNVALLQRLFWDGRASSLEEQCRGPMLNAKEMGLPNEESAVKALSADPAYPPLFAKAFGDEKITFHRVVRAIAAFERTLLAGDSPFDRWWNGDESAMKEDAIRGFRIFSGKASCVQCHNVRQNFALFTDGEFHNTGAGKGPGKDDPGRFTVTNREEDRGAFRTPTVRNVALTAPYMHDGSLATLEDVVEFYAKGGEKNPHLSPLMRPVTLDPTERADLVAFMKALTSPTLPQLEECDKLLAAGRPRDAFDAFDAALKGDPADARALLGVARAAVALDDAKSLAHAVEELRRRVAALPADRSGDGVEPAPSLLFWLARTCQVLSRRDPDVVHLQDEAIAALQRAHATKKAPIEAYVLEARMVEALRSTTAALAVLDDGLKLHPDDLALTEIRAGVLCRSVSREQPLRDDERERVTEAVAAFEKVLKGGLPLSDDAAMERADAHRRLGDIERARAAYADAVARPAIADAALQGLRKLLSRDMDVYRRDLETLLERHPDSTAVLLFSAFEALQRGRLDDAERDLKHRLEVEKPASAPTYYYLARIAVRRGDRPGAMERYAAAFAIDPTLRGLAMEYEDYLATRVLTGFKDQETLVGELRAYLAAGPRDPSFQVHVLTRMSQILRGIATSYCSRGPGRIWTFAEGAPQRARDALGLALKTADEAVALVPEDAEKARFGDRWRYAAALAMAGEFRHYFSEFQDFARAEQLYLRAFELTAGAHADASICDLQLLYGFELPGRDAKWLEITSVAKDAIQKVDEKAPNGFSPDFVKRAEALREFERLNAALKR